MSVILKNSPREKLFFSIKNILEDMRVEAQTGDEKAQSRLSNFRKSVELHFINNKAHIDCMDCRHGTYFLDLEPSGAFYLQLGGCLKLTTAPTREEGGMPPNYCTSCEHPDNDNEITLSETPENPPQQAAAVAMLDKLISGDN